MGRPSLDPDGYRLLGGFPVAINERRTLRPSEQRYARILSRVTPFSLEDATAAVRRHGRYARNALDASLWLMLRPP